LYFVKNKSASASAFGLAAGGAGAFVTADRFTPKRHGAAAFVSARLGVDASSNPTTQSQHRILAWQPIR
jgi:O-antigen ligase